MQQIRVQRCFKRKTTVLLQSRKIDARAPHTQKKKKSGNVNVNVFVPQAGGGSHNRRTETAAYLVRHCEIKRNKKCERRQ